jgi:RNA polymerase sigma factor (sigma-70 family)
VDSRQPLAQTETALTLRAALSTLDLEHREVLILHEVQGFKYREIAQILDCPVGTVKSRVHYAIAALRAALAESSNMEVDHDV